MLRSRIQIEEVLSYFKAFDRASDFKSSYVFSISVFNLDSMGGVKTFDNGETPCLDSFESVRRKL